MTAPVAQLCRRSCQIAFLASLKRTLNISGTEVAVVTEDDVHSQFDRVSGTVILQGGDYEQAGKSIKLELKEFWTETRSSGQGSYTTTVFKVHQAVTLANTFSFQPRFEQSYPFEVRLPMNCRISTRDTGWRLVVTMDIPGARDPTGTVNLEVQPAEEFLAIIEACELAMRFQEETRFQRWHQSTGATRFRLSPPTVLKSELDFLRLELLQNPDGKVTGSLIFDLQEHSLADYFKVIGARDEVKKPITLAREDIFLSDGDINEAGITEAVSRSLQDVLSERHRAT